MFQTTIQRFMNEGLHGDADLYVFRARGDVLYVGKSNQVQVRLFDHINGEPRGNRALFRAIRRFYPESCNWPIDLYNAEDVYRWLNPPWFSLAGCKRYIDEINTRNKGKDFGILGVWKPLPWHFELKVDTAENLLISHLRPALNVMSNSDGIWPHWLPSWSEL